MHLVEYSISEYCHNLYLACGIPTYLKENGSYVPCIDWNQRKMDKQAEYYSIVLQACLDIDGCTFFASWGFTDLYTWIDTGILSILIANTQIPLKYYK